MKNILEAYSKNIMASSLLAEGLASHDKYAFLREP